MMVDLLYLRGAAEVHVRIGSPPIIAPCYFGIDMTSREQLIASSKTIAEIEQLIHADSLGYISIAGLVSAIGINADGLCLGCVTEDYPLPIPGEKYRLQKSLKSYP